MGFLFFGSTWFWIFFLIASILVIIATEKGSGIGATATLVITVALYFFFGNKIQLKNFFSYIIENPWSTIAVIIGYIIVGTCWSILKWYFFLIKERDRRLERVANSTSGYIDADIPKVSNHKSEIMVWMFYWPYSAVWTILDHPIKKIFIFIYKRIHTKLQEMANKIFAPLAEMEKKREAERHSHRTGAR